MFIYLDESVKFVSIKNYSSEINDLNDKIINKRTHNKDGSLRQSLKPRVINFKRYFLKIYIFDFKIII